MLDRITVYYVSLLKVKGSRPSLPPKERDLIGQELGDQGLAEYDRLVEQFASSLSSSGFAPPTIMQTQNEISRLDDVIVELMRLRKRSKPSVSALSGIKRIIAKVTTPIWIGSAVIALDISLQSWASILSGMYIIGNALSNCIDE